MLPPVPPGLVPGDILHVMVGADLGDGQVWVPTAEELEEIQTNWQAIVPEDVTVIATHAWIRAEVVGREMTS